MEATTKGNARRKLGKSEPGEYMTIWAIAEENIRSLIDYITINDKFRNMTRKAQSNIY